jgi:hypothetical protein
VAMNISKLCAFPVRLTMFRSLWHQGDQRKLYADISPVLQLQTELEMLPSGKMVPHILTAMGCVSLINQPYRPLRESGILSLPSRPMMDGSKNETLWFLKLSSSLLHVCVSHVGYSRSYWTRYETISMLVHVAFIRA